MITGKLFAEAVDSLVEGMRDCAKEDTDCLGYTADVRSACLHDDVHTVWLEGTPEVEQNRLFISPGPEVIFQGMTFRMAFIQTEQLVGTLMPLVPKLLYTLLNFG
jgi:hypothetical protein